MVGEGLIPKLSVGFLDNAELVIRSIEKNNLHTKSELLELLNSDEITLRRSRGLIFDLCIASGWIGIDEKDILEISPKISGYLLSNSTFFQRELFLDYINKFRPVWTIHLRYGIRAMRSRIADVDIIQLFSELGLLPDIDDIDKFVAEWWIRARRLSREINNEALAQIGLEGELLTIEYEKRRTGKTPIHISVDSDSHGFDVLSIKSIDDESELLIEVKASNQRINFASLYLSRNEFETGKKCSDHYIIHLWEISPTKAQLLVIPFLEITNHIPVDQGFGSWKEVSIKYSSFDWDEAINFKV